MGRPFVFRLEHVLQHRQMLEEQARIELAMAQGDYQAQVRLLDGLRLKVNDMEKRLRSRTDLSAEELWLWTSYREHLLQEIERNDFLLQRHAARVAECRTELVQRAKDLKVLERLKTKQAVEYHVEQKRKEQKELDEAASLRHQYKGF